MKFFMRALKVVFIRKIYLLDILSILLISLLPSCKIKNKERSEEELMKIAQNICESNIIIDSHIDWPEWVINIPEDISRQTLKGDFDLDRANKGGLNAALSVAYINSHFGLDSARIVFDYMLNKVKYYAKRRSDENNSIDCWNIYIVCCFGCSSKSYSTDC